MPDPNVEFTDNDIVHALAPTSLIGSNRPKGLFHLCFSISRYIGMDHPIR